MSAKSEFHIASLDGIRGIAALIVFISHATRPDLIPGGFGVTVFFFLSGYLITTLLRMEFERSGDISLSRFYLRRVYRILPPMYIVLMSVMLLAFWGVLPHAMKLEGVAAQFAHLANYYMIVANQKDFVPGTSVVWSLAVEEHFYLLFPIVASMLFKWTTRKRMALWLLAFCGLVFAWRCVLVLAMGVDADRTYLATDTRIDSILYGCVLAMWMNPALDKEAASIGSRAGLAMIATAGAVLLSTFLYRDEIFRETLRYSLQSLALFPLFFCAVRFASWPLFAWLESRPMRAMGLISYTFYLVHVPVLQLLNRHSDLGKVGLFVNGLMVTIAVSAAMYWLVERHMTRLRKRSH